MITLLTGLEYNSSINCSVSMYEYIIGYLIIMIMTLIIEIMALCYSCKGTIMDTRPRRFLQHLIYSRLLLTIIETILTIVGIVYLTRFFNQCNQNWYDKRMLYILIALVLLSLGFVTTIVLIIILAYDRAGKNFHKLTVLERTPRKYSNRKGSSILQWMHRKTITSYYNNWKFGCGLLSCFEKADNNREAFENIAENLTFLFYKFDLVASDVLAGLLLIREQQKINKAQMIKKCNKDGVFDYLSSVPITENTKFFNLNSQENLEKYKDLVYFFEYAAASYGWPMYVYRSSCACFRPIANLQ